MATLYIHDGAAFRAAESQEVICQAQCLISKRFRAGSPTLGTPAKTREYLRLHLGALGHEVFGVLHLDARRRLIAAQDLFRGTVTQSAVHVREVVKAALQHEASSLIAYHNHPSGSVEPSPADDYITHRLKDALALVEIDLIDHLIVGEVVYSFAEHGLL